jgi:MoaA/NifB/PqqE/SkfB family radical SAM enzyme
MNLAGMWAGVEPTRPLMFSYYVTHRCKLNCRYCCDGDGKRFAEDPIPELDTADAKRLLSILRQAGDTLDVTGGEPLLRGDLEEILAHARSLGLRTILNTKGIGLTGRPDLLHYTDVLVLSLDTLDPDALAGLIGRPRPVAEEILATLDRALAACRRTGTRIVLAAVATPDNLEHVAEVLRFAADNSLGFQVSPEILGTEVNPALRENDRYRVLIDQTLNMKRTRGRVLGVPQYLLGIRDMRAFRCHPLLMPVIRPDGRMYYPCLEWKQAQISLLEAGSYWGALQAARARFGRLPDCRNCCHIFCHMALSLLQTHPLSALGELRHWRSLGPPVEGSTP